jgi:hypothetical protein
MHNYTHTESNWILNYHGCFPLKVHNIENFFGFDFEFCTISLLVMHK